MRKNEVLFWIIAAITVSQLFWQNQYMPAKMASHFNWEGQADGWASRDTHVWLMLMTYGIMALCFGILPMVIGRLPVSMINLPHREYWLAPERVKGTIGIIRDRVANLGVMTFLFFMVVNYLVGEANKVQPPKLPAAFIWCLVIYIVVTIIWSIRFVLDFRKPEDGSHPPDRSKA